MSQKGSEQGVLKEPSAGLSRAKLELLARRLRGKGNGKRDAGRIPRRAPGGAPPPLSFAQERLWFLAQLEPDNPNYNTLANLRFGGRLNVPLLEQVVGEVLRRHEVLRTTFEEFDGRVSQVVGPAEAERLPLVDLSGLPEGAREARARKLVGEWARRPLNPARERPLRLALLRLGAEEHVVLQNAHHIVWDAWSAGIFGREVGTLQGAYGAGRPSPLAELPLQYADFAAWQREWMAGDVLGEQLAYWRRQLEGAPPVLELPTDRPRPPVQTYAGRSQGCRLPSELAVRLRALGQAEGATLFMVLLAAFDVLLYRYTGQTDVVVGTPIANRNRSEVESLIGFFINTLVLRTRLDGDPTFRELLRRVSETTFGAYAHQDLPFERLVEELKPQRSLSHSPLFQVLFSVDNARRELLRFSDLRQNAMRAGNDSAKFDLSFLITESPEDLSVAVEYNCDLFDDETVARLLEHFRALLEAVVEDADRPVSALPMLGPDELRRLLEEWNNTRAEFDTQGAIHELFERQAARTPDAVAVTFEDENITYRELNASANRLARRLRGLGVGPERLAGVMLTRSPRLVVSLLAVLKAGGAYVPLDPEYPAERLAFMAEDAGVGVLLTERGLLDRLPRAEGARVLVLDEPQQEIDRQSGDDLPAAARGFNSAYVIYTSGSTGRPKGVLIEHHSALTLLHWARRYYTDEQLACVLASTSVCFDLSVFELFVPLSWGGTVVLAENALQLPSLPAAQSVTLINTVPSAMTELVRARLVPPSVTTVNLAGEALKNQLVQQIYGPGRVERVINLYGPSEDTTYSTVAPTRKGTLAEPSIGRPISNTQVYLLDQHLRPVPVRVAGELYIGGEGLARGYLNRPGLTAERFIPDPFSMEPGGRLYRTGDLARFDREGEIEYLGRADHQVKVRGFRIELGEIEAVLGQHTGVSECVVVAEHESEGAGHRLVAFYAGAAGAGELREYLRERLPGYMVPSVFVALERLPLTPNGKVDRRALPAPERRGGEGAAEFVEPRNAVERAVAEVWCEVLGLERVSADANFFDLGGHSLLVMRVLSRLREAFPVELPLRTLFESPTVAGVARAVEGLLGVTLESLAPDREAHDPRAEAVPELSILTRGGELPLSFAQERMWFIDQLEPGSPVYNMPVALRLTGALNVETLRQSFSEVVRRHESLRTSFRTVEGRPAQFIAPEPALDWRVIDLRGMAGAARSRAVERLTAEEARRPFELARGPLLRATLMLVGDGEQVLTLTMHHIISDGQSMNVLVREVVTLYEAFRSGLASPLAELPLQYADFAVWQRRWLQGEVLAEHLSYWRRQLEGAPPVLELPTDRPRPPVQTHRGALVGFTIPPELVERLKRLARAQDATLFTLLLAAFQTLLARYSRQHDVSVGVPVSGRNRVEVEGLIGLFINMLVLRLRHDPRESFRGLLARARATMLEALAHQELPFEKLLEELQPERNLSHTPLFQAVLVMQDLGDAGGAARTAGLVIVGLRPDVSRAKFDLTMSLAETGRGLSGTIEYKADLFEEATVARMARHFETLLRGAAENPDAEVGRLPLLTPAEERGLLALDRTTPAHGGLRPTRGLAEIFEEQAARAPDRIGVVGEAEALTYGELNRRANRLAHRLRRLGVGPESRVCVCLGRSAEMVVALLAVVKAGGAYVPLDPAYPRERLSFIVEDVAPCALITERQFAERLPQDGVKVLLLDEDWPEIERESAANPHASAAPENAAYVIYTSGSTGRPKGVLVTHANVVRLFDATEPWFGFDEGDAWTLFHSYTFDFSVWELWGALLKGGRLVVVPYWVSRSAEAFRELLAAEQVTVLNQTPTAFRQLIAADESRAGAGGVAGTADALEWVVFGGEALELQSLRPWVARHGDTRPRLVNMYGITETTVHVTFRPLALEDLDAGAGSVIGRPIPDLQVYALDEEGQLVPPGVAGELYVGGAGLARGYLNRPGLTAERFIPDPFSMEPGGRLYRTGDLARRRADRGLEYLGRIDEQVKIRGFRIEPGEVEAALAQMPEVADCAVVARREAGGESRLVAYLVARGGPAPSPGVLRAFLKERLPEHMIPAAFVGLERLPLTPNGKLDRRALPAPDTSRADGAEEYVAPRTAAEQALAEVWAEVLGVERVGVRDNFFNLGGDSIRSIQLLAHARRRGLDFTVQQLFQHQTIESLLGELSDTSAAPSPESPRHVEPFSLISQADRERLPADVEDAYPLTRLQAGMLFHSAFEDGAPVYHNVSSYHLRAPLDFEALRAAVDRLLANHPVLRTSFDVVGYSEPLQLVHRHAAAEIGFEDIGSLTHEEQERAVALWFEAEQGHSFDWQTAPLVRFHVQRRGEETFQFSVTEHHAILDGWSVATMLTELFGHYTAALGMREASPPPPPALTFSDYVAREQEALRAGEGRRFWSEMLSGSEAGKLPRLRQAAGESRANQGGKLHVPVSAETSEGLRRLAREAGVPVKSVLLAAHLKVMSLFGASEDVVTGLVTNGRTEEQDGERVLGLFLNTLPFRLRLGGQTWEEFVRETFEREREMMPHRLYPLAELQREAGGRRLFETLFNFTHFHVYEAVQKQSGVRVLGDLSVAETNFDFETDFSLDLTGSQVQLVLGYDTRAFGEELVGRIGVYYRRVLDEMAAEPSRRHDASHWLTADELRVLGGLNDTARDFADERLLHELFEEQAARAPDAVAVSFEGSQTTYAELNRRADALANRLRRAGVGTESRVCILVERSAEQIVALLGVLKAGGAYVPLDTAYAPERLAFMFEDSGACALVTQRGLAGRFETGGAPTLFVDSAPAEGASGFEAAGVTEGGSPAEGARCAVRVASDSRGTTPDSLAYVIYTSGSTGRPKGAGVSHRSLVNAFHAWDEVFELAGLRCHLQTANFSFDVFTADVTRALCAGSRLVICPPEVLLDGEGLRRLVGEEGVEFLDIVPAVMRPLMRSVEAAGRPPGSVRVLVVGSDSWYGEEYEWCRRLCGEGARVVNSYGLTEATVDTTFYEGAGGELPPGGMVPAGRPYANMRTYVLDRRGRSAPLGVDGELYVGGAGLARGYVGRPDLTAERFVPVPFAGAHGERLYRTGDLARLDSNGVLTLLGRADNQVKVRGYRIEPGEIESVLTEHEGVGACAVLARGAGEQRLVAYVEPRGERLSAGELRSYLAGRLPGYMLPSEFVTLERLPLAANGKVDRRALAARDDGPPERERRYVAPRDLLEHRMARVWEESLHVPDVGVTDGFFELGGHSLSAIGLMARIRQEFGRALPLAALFQDGTVEKLAELLRRDAPSAADWSPLVPLQPQGALPPFFCVHPVGGGVLCYAELARRMGTERPFYALQARGLEDGREPQETVEEMAGLYVEAIKAVQPAGPYHVGGWSLGGVVAYEMARQLRARGDEVALLALIDSTPPGAPASDSNGAGGHGESLLLEFARDLCALHGRRLSPEQLARASAEGEGAGYLLAEAKGAGLVPPHVGPEDFGRLLSTYAANLHALRRYAPGTYDGSVTLFAAAGPGDSAGSRALEGWRGLTSGRVEVREVPGDHYSLMREPDVDVLAGALGDCMRRLGVSV